ncbi:MAG TPA: autotransporter-associated beta strand repeat-containing protein, partial [Prosthecobacter sp.]|nr:autotransporter-associated beta strand repeat-containing protein [Prosthecobacter sp.]
LNLLAGANTITASETGTSPTADRLMTITVASMLRSNRSTLLVRGQNLGTLAVGTTGAFIVAGRVVSTAAPTLTGGAGAAATTSISIVPWVIGDTSITGTGASFVTYAATTGFRPLNTTTEYEQLTAAGGITAANNVRYSAGADLTLDSSAARSMNALLLENTGAGGITLAGAGGSLNLVAGAVLAVGAQPLTITGFSGITTGALNEYIFHVPNTAAAGLTVNSPMTTTAAALTKSGAGVLILSSTGSTYTGPTTINQGVLQIDAMNKLGNNGSGGLILNGGTLRFGASFDPSTVAITLGVPATAEVVTSAGGVFDTNGFDVTLANAIGGGGNGNLTKAGAGVLTLGAIVTYTGGTIVNAGTLSLGVANALPSSMNLTLAGGIFNHGAFATQLNSLKITANSTITGSAALTFAGNVEVDNSRTLTVNNSGGTTFAGDYFYLVNNGTTGRTTTIAGSGPVTIDSAISNGTAAGSVTYTGNSTLTLSGLNTYTGTTTMNNAAGAIVFSGSNPSAGGTTLTNGTLRFNSAFNGGLASGTLTLTTGTLQALNASRVLSNTTLLGGTVTVSGSENLTFNGSFTNNAGSRTLNSSITGATLTLAGPVYLSETTGTGRTLTIGGTGNTLISGAIANFNGGAGTAGAVVITNGGLTTLSGVNTYTGATTIGSASVAAGTLRVNSGSNISNAATTVFSGTLDLLNAAQSITTLVMGNGPAGSTSQVAIGGALTLGGTVTYTASTTSGKATISGGTLNLGANRTFTINDSTAASLEMEISSGIAGAFTVTKGGAGSLLFSGANSYTGSTTVSAGVLSIANDSALGTTAGNTVVSSGAALQLQNNITIGNEALSIAGAGNATNGALRNLSGNNSWGGAVTLTAAATIQSDTGTLSLNVASGNAITGTFALTFAGAGNIAVHDPINISTAALTKNGTGVLNLLGTSTFSGGTTVNAGTLLVSNLTGSATGTGAVTIGAAGILGGTGIVSGNVSLTGTVAPGALDLAGASLPGQLTVGSLTINSGATLQIQLGGATVLDPDNMRLLQSDPGSFTVPASWTNYQAGETDHDQLYLSNAGVPNLNGLTIQVMPSYLDGFVPSYGHVFQIIDWFSLGTSDAVGGVSFNLPTLDPGYGWETSLLNSHGIVAVIPEPSRMLLLFLGFLGLAFRRRRRTA